MILDVENLFIGSSSVSAASPPDRQVIARVAARSAIVAFEPVVGPS